MTDIKKADQKIGLERTQALADLLHSGSNPANLLAILGRGHGMELRRMGYGSTRDDSLTLPHVSPL